MKSVGFYSTSSKYTTVVEIKYNINDANNQKIVELVDAKKKRELFEAETSKGKIHVAITKNKLHILYVYIAISVRINNKTKRINLVSLGKLRYLQDKMNCTLEQIKDYCEKGREGNEEFYTKIEEMYFEQKLAFKYNPFNAAQKSNYGCTLVHDFLDQFNIYSVFNNPRHDQVNYLIYALTAAQIINPSSKQEFVSTTNLRMYNNRTTNNAAISRALKIFGEKKHEIYQQVNHKLQEMKVIDPSQDVTLFFDITNFFTARDEASGMAQVGKSKENRHSPIYQYGIFMSDSGIPLSAYTFPGNTADCKALIPALKLMSEDTGITKFTLVADKAFNTADIIDHIIGDLEACNYIVGSKCKTSHSPVHIRDFIRAKSPWINVELEPQHGEFTRLSFIHMRKANDTYVAEKVVCEWNHSKALLERKMREDFLERVSGYSPTKLHGWNTKTRNSKYCDSYIQTRNGEKIYNAQNVKTISAEKVELDRLHDGVNAYVTNQTDKINELVAKTYRNLVKIEECFRIMKSVLKARPFYCHHDETVEGHLVVCFLALLFIRLVNYATNSEVTPRQLQLALQDLEGKRFGKSFYEVNANQQRTYKVLDKLGFKTISADKLMKVQKLNVISTFARGWMKNLIQKKVEASA